MTKECNYDSYENKFSEALEIIQVSDCYSSCIGACPESLKTGGKCAAVCSLEKLGNDVCDQGKVYLECNLQACGWDLGKCAYCADGCAYDNLIDSARATCDISSKCNTASCRYDLGRCG